MAPVVAPPSVVERDDAERVGRANGIAPSVMNDAPRSQDALPFSRSAA